MKSIFKLSTLLGAAALLLAVSSCSKVEELDTQHYSDDKVMLASFGPNPVMRGAQLRFFGSNLDQIETVEVPGIDAVRSIEVVKAGKVSEIRITLPVEGPEVGYVVLTAKDGTKFQTMSELTYTEPIVFESFSANSPAFPGETVVLRGDYMNLVKTVEFAGGEKVEVLPDATRHEASVIIPANAISGKIVLSDGGSVENLFYSEDDLVIGEPTLDMKPVETARPGSTITITGKHLEMIEKLVLQGAEVEDFALSADNSSITFVVPATAADGFITAVSYAGAEYVTGGILAVIPEIKSVSPSPVKAGKTLTVTGTDLDLVTNVAFVGVDNASFSYADGALSVAVPAEAQEGAMVLSLANGYTVEAEIALVHPEITEVSPLELFAGEEDVTVNGKDLDLIVKAVIGTKEVSIKSQSATAVVLETELSSVSGTVKLTLANGETIESEQSVVMKYRSKVIVSSINAAQNIGQPVSISGEHLNLIENIFIGDVKVTDYEYRQDDQIVFFMPWNYVGEYPVKFHLFDGDDEIQANPIKVDLELKITNVFDGYEDLGEWGPQPYFGADGALQGIAAIGDYLRVYYTPLAGDYNVQIFYGHWESMVKEITSGSVEYTGYYDIPVTSDNLGILTTKSGWGGVLLAQGQHAAVTKVDYIHEVPQEITVFDGPCDMTWGDDGRFGIAKEAFDGLVSGSKLIFYITHTHDWGQIQLNDGWWGNGDIVFPEVNGAYIKTDNIPAGATRVELTLTDDLLSIFNERTGGYAGINTSNPSPSGTYSMVIQGSDMRVDKVTVLK